MKILIVGSGGREHALGYSIAKNKNVEKIFFAPGNAGTLSIGENVNIKADNIDALADYASTNNIDYTIVGPEDPLCMGIVDVFEAKGLKIFGPSKAAAKLEESKAFAKEFMIKHNIPTAEYVKTSNYNDAVVEAEKLINKYGVAVLKADALAQGKGVYIAYNIEEAKDFCNKIFNEKLYGTCDMVVEEYLDGFEMSLLCFVDNKTIKALPTAKDHKKIFDGEKGLNTGGMGTYSPNLQADVYLPEIEENTLKPFLKGIQEDNLDFRGIIFIGFMIGSKGIKVLEFNTRFGDPETQSVLQRLDTDLLDIMKATSESKLGDIEIKFNDKKVITLVLASGGYPEAYPKGKVITNLDSNDAIVFHAGTTTDNGNVVTAGGRVLGVTAVADTFEECYNKVYKAADNIEFEGKYFRKDISPLVKRVYIEKKEAFDVESAGIINEIKDGLNIDIAKVRIFQRYDLENISNEELVSISTTILSEPPVDNIYLFNDALNLQKELNNTIVVQFHKGQFDQREQGLLETIAVAIEKSDVSAKCSKVYSFEATTPLTPSQMKQIEKILINPVDQEKGSLLEIPTTLKDNFVVSHQNEFYEGFINMNNEELQKFLVDNSFAFNFDDLCFIQNYFKTEGRNPSKTELGMIDTYWSDHCRHTTFMTHLTVEGPQNLQSELDKTISKAFNDYVDVRNSLGRQEKPITLMDLATIVGRYMRKNGLLNDEEVSEEINACSVRIKIDIKDIKTGEIKEEDYLLMFKNETHNHPTEIEPFGGASTCIGGAIRDPLSGRSYVYQAMRVTGSGDPRERLEDTIEGKLPQKKITVDAARGYSSYGNQIGLATGLVDEVYHPGYKAKRMEVGAVIGAAPAENVKRESPEEGDIIVLLGGRTGRDGVGGATGSSKAHTEKSITVSSAEVQKGNAPMERKLQRLFRNEEAAKMIKKCNDFGAGGVSVAIGEVADSLHIWLERIPLKYQGLTPREIAISESQERMAVVIRKTDYNRFAEICYDENLELTHVADVTNSNRLVMTYNGNVIVDLSRDFLNTSGADRKQVVTVANIDSKIEFFSAKESKGVECIYDEMADLNVCSKRNLIERFDSSIGRGSVLVPMGGKTQMTPAPAMAAIIPTLKGESQTASVMSYGFNPYLSEENQFIGAYYAVIESLSKLAAVGGNPLKARLSFQEYFERLDDNASKWSKPLMSLLGAFKATMDLNTPPIGGKDSMSGTFKNISVPPTLISFAVTTEKAINIISPELKGNNKIGIISTSILGDYTLNIEEYKSNVTTLVNEIHNGNVVSCQAINHKGILPLLSEMAIGNCIGFDVNIANELLYKPLYGSFIVEYKNDNPIIKEIGCSTGEQATAIANGTTIELSKISSSFNNTLNKVFSGELGGDDSKKPLTTSKQEVSVKSTKPVEVPKVVIPVFPGTNCEYDTAYAFEREGAQAEIIVLNNLSIENIEKSINKLSAAIKESQILMFPGGFSLGDEPDGSGKFIANVIQNPKIKASIEYMLKENDGLILGICNGFQALIKSGLLPYNKIGEQASNSPTLTYNSNARHIARFIDSKLETKKSPWLALCDFDALYKIPISHGEGRFICDEENYKKLYENGQVAFSYIDNPNGSDYNIEGIISPDGKILGKMGHTERLDHRLYKNIPAVIEQPIIKAGVQYFIK